MKKLSNVSPFVLLLVPVLFMMVLAFVGIDQNEQEELALKTTTSTSVIAKATAIVK